MWPVGWALETPDLEYHKGSPGGYTALGHGVILLGPSLPVGPNVQEGEEWLKSM